MRGDKNMFPGVNVQYKCSNYWDLTNVTVIFSLNYMIELYYLMWYLNSRLLRN